MLLGGHNQDLNLAPFSGLVKPYRPAKPCLSARQRKVIFSTHLAGDVGAAAARVLLLDHVRLLFDGPASGLIDRARGRVFEALVADHELRELARRYRVTTRVRKRDGIHVRAVARGDEQPPGAPAEPNVEEAYLANCPVRAITMIIGTAQAQRTPPAPVTATSESALTARRDPGTVRP